MDILNSYRNIKSFLTNNIGNFDTIESDIELILDILNDWLDSGYNSKDFEKLMYTIKDDYLYTGKAYRGITLLKDSDESIENRIYFHKTQSFSKDKEIAIRFANNYKVTIGEEINVDRKPDEVIPILLEINCKNVGIDLNKFAQEMIVLCKNIIKSDDMYNDLETVLSYALEEEEVLFYPSIISILKEDVEKIKIHEI